MIWGIIGRLLPVTVIASVLLSPAASANRPLTSCLAEEKVAIGAAVSSAAASTHMRRTGKSLLLSRAAAKEIAASGGMALQIPGEIGLTDLSRFEKLLPIARSTGATMLMVLELSDEDPASGKEIQGLEMIQRVIISLRGIIADVRTGEILSHLELPPLPVPGISRDAAHHLYVNERGYGVADGILEGLEVACGQRAALALVAKAEPAPAGSSKSKQHGKGTNSEGPPPARTIKPGRHRAIVVGISQYRHLYERTPSGLEAFKPLKYAHHDAMAFSRFLSNPSVSGANWEITMLIDEHATRENLDEAITNIIDSALKSDVIILFFSGHGAATGRSNEDVYLLTHDANPRSVSSGLHFNHLVERMKRSDALQIVAFIDACRAGAAAGKGEAADFALLRSRAEEAVGKMRIFHTAASANQLAFESDELKHGVYTHFLLEGLKNAKRTAITGRSEKTAITLDELHTYVAPKVIAYTSDRGRFPSTQHPALHGDVGMENAPEAWPLGFSKGAGGGD